MPNPDNKQTNTVGVFELVRFPQFGNQQVIAKLDTGAFTGALHCNSIVEKQTENGPILEIMPLDQSHPVSFDEYAVKYVRSSNGIREKRFFIDTTIELSGNIYELVLSLTDRKDMKWQILIGRRFLRQHGFVVDARKPSHYGNAKGPKA